jgi:DNA-binding CsgD family transcriptional regulator/tetratricopeptide (TPR) repeat protein
VITLPRMDADNVGAVIAASLGTRAAPEELIELVRDASGGVPFLIEELLTSLVDVRALWRDGDRWRTTGALPSLVPSSFAVLVADRLASLSPPARRVVEAAAVLGEQFEWRLVGRVTGLTDHEIVAALREAVGAQLVDEATEPPPRFRFRHGLSRAAVLETLLGPERELLARQALDVLDSDAGEGGVAPPDSLHLELVAGLAVIGRCDVAVRALIDASAAAVGRGDCLSAARSAELAVRLAVTDDEAIDAGDALLAACVASGDTARAAEVGRRLLFDLERVGADAQRVVAAQLQLATAAVHATDWSRAEAHLDQVEEGVPPTAACARARIDLLWASVALGRHTPRAAVDHARRAGDAARETGDSRLLTEALLLLGRAHRVLDVDAARKDFGAALDVAQRTGSQLLAARAAHEAATLDVLTAGPTRRMEEARELAAAVATALTAVVDTHLAIIHCLHFDLDASRAAAERAVDATNRYDLGLLAGTSAIIPAMCAAMSGRRHEAVAQFERSLPQMDTEIEATGRGHVVALAALACEDRAAALEQLELAAALAPEYSGVARAPHCGLRVLLLAVDGADAASVVAGRLEADAAVVGVARAFTELALAVFAGRTGERAEAVRLTRRAFDALDPTPWYLAIGQRLVSEAALQEGWGSPTAWLRSALEFFETASLPELADACRRMLRTAGAPVPRQPSRGHDPELSRLGVTVREAEVLALVADGLSNREVAARLVLSVRTVEKHVERLMTKTLTTNRVQLAAFATRLASSGTGTT